MFKFKKVSIDLTISGKWLNFISGYLESQGLILVIAILSAISIGSFLTFYWNGLGLAYNDARSHLDIGRRVVEGLKPGLAQLGSVWLPLPHILMIPTIWNDFMWHSGLAGAIQSMIAYVATGALIYLTLRHLGVGVVGRLFGVMIFATNLNVLYLQSTAMTELLLMASTSAATYYLISWTKSNKLVDLIKIAFWVMLASLTRYDGWFLLMAISAFIFGRILLKKGYKSAEGVIIVFGTLAGLGVIMWFMWNLIIFKDPLYFALGPYSARAQQTQLEAAGNLLTKGNLWYSTKTYLYALFYNIYTFTALVGFVGALVLWFDKKISKEIRFASTVLFTPLIFNIIALILGHSVLFVQGINGDTWFNARYGIVFIPSVAIFIGYLVNRFQRFRPVLIGLLIFVTIFSMTSGDAVTIDDARVGSSQKNVTEVSGWLQQHTADKTGFILISAASHDAIIFSSNLPMKKFIHEGTGAYWDSATASPDRWARWIVMRTYDENDQTYRLVKSTDGFAKYRLIANYPFASIYELRDEYLSDLNTKPVLGRQK